MDKEMKEVLQSQLNNEEDVIKDLKKIYKQALDDCKSKIELLSARAELNPDNLQSVIYQKNYQEAIKAQLEGVMMGLDSDAYSTISEYLSKCYEEGFVGVMYDIAAQGIPMVVPIDPKQVMKAIQVDSKLSEKYYKGDPLKGRLDEDVKSLKKAVSSELSRGIANGSTWNQVAANLARNFKNTPFNKAYNDSIRIARTEGHRVQIQSALDAQEKAKAKGADIVKQWDSTLDGNTRPHHRQLDGQIREVEEPFELGNRKVKAPGMFGDPAEDCNCRCGLLQRARWALDDDELETLKERAAYHGLLVDDSKKFGQEKAKDFSDYKKKYLNATVQLKYVLQFFANKSDKDALNTLIKNGTIDKANFDKCYNYFRGIFKNGIKSPIETVYDKKDQFYHIAQRHIDMISKDNIDRIVKSISNPTNIYETVDKFGIMANCYLLEEKGEKTLLTIVRNGIITSYEPGKSYLEKIKKGKKLW